MVLPIAEPNNNKNKTLILSQPATFFTYTINVNVIISAIHWVLLYSIYRKLWEFIRKPTSLPEKYGHEKLWFSKELDKTTSHTIVLGNQLNVFQ